MGRLLPALQDALNKMRSHGRASRSVRQALVLSCSKHPAGTSPDRHADPTSQDTLR